MDDRELNSTGSLPGAIPSRTAREPVFRLDGPHFMASPAPTASSPPAPARPPRRETNILLEASAMLQQLQDELAEQERREAALVSRESELAEKQTAFTQWAGRIRAELEEQRETLWSSESALAVRLAALDKQLRELDEQHELLERERQAVQELRTSTEVDARRQMASELAELEQLKEQVAREFSALTAERQKFEQERFRSQQEAEVLLATERQELWQALTAEWQQHRTAFEQEQASWLTQQSVREAELRQQRERYDQALLGLDSQLANRRAAVEAELAGLREVTLRELDEARTAWQQEQQSHALDHQKEKSLFEARMRFQQDHLEKMRHELELQQEEFRAERQKLQQQLEEDTRQLARRVEQWQVVQKGIEEQSAALDRERETLLKCREAWDSSVVADRESLRAEQMAWEDDRRRQQIELQRQREVIAGHSESLERKRARLERLRMELEDTHRTTLELRLAVEEAWAQIADVMGSDEAARVRVDEARQSLSLYYRELHAAMVAQREELFDLQTRLDQQRIAFHEERQTLMQWLSERDAALRSDEERLRGASADIAAREAQWLHDRDRWLSEKVAAEARIRQLLKELGRESVAA